MAVAEFYAVVIPTGGPILDGFVNHQVKLTGLGPAEERVHFKNRGDFDQRERKGVGFIFFLVLLVEQVDGFGWKPGAVILMPITFCRSS